MKQTILLSLLCLLYFNTTAQNENIRILVFPFEVSDEVLDTTLAVKVPDKLQEALERDFLFVNTDDGTRYIIQDWVYDNEPEIAKDDLAMLEVLKLRAPNYYITGKIYEDQLTVKVQTYPENELAGTFSEKWNLSKTGLAYETVETIADRVWGKLENTYGASEFSARLILKSKAPEAIISLNRDELGKIGKKEKLPIRSKRPVRIKVGVQSEVFQLDDYAINQIRIKPDADGGYKINRIAFAAQLTGGLNNLDTDISYSTDAALRFLFRKGFSLGLQIQYYYLLHRYEYPTLEGLAPKTLEQKDYLLNFGILGMYERYLSPARIIWNAEAYTILFPEFGGGIRLGIAHESLPFLQVKVGYQWFEATTDQAIFNPFGDADFEPTTNTFKGVFVGLGLQHYF
ncbi:MAG: hypothetical protein AAGI49_09250 [Bacteroidota bacterium]